MLLLELMLACLAFAEDGATRLAPIQVLGGSREELVLPTAPQRVGKEKLESSQYTDVNRALKQVAGVYVREEEGQGFRPNIGLRGTNPDRSKKVVILEDGVLIGPAPYSAPAAYYTPNMNHVETLEVYKGFTAIPFGPNSIGGAVNYLSPSVPSRPTANVSAQSGAFGARNLKFAAGTGTEGGLGVLLQGSRFSGDGFKRIDGGGDAGFLRNDVHVQGRTSLTSGERVNLLTARFGFSDEDSHETYLGLTRNDFNRDAFRRYSSSANDEMVWKHHKMQLEHELQTGRDSFLRTTLYRHQFHRSWYRVDSFRGGSMQGLRSVMKDPKASVLNRALYEILTGQSDSSSLGQGGEIKIVNNDRRYLSQGVQSSFLESLDWGSARHDLEFSLRWHRDRIERNHSFDFYEMTGGRLARTQDPRQQETLNEASADARTLGVQDNVSVGPWVFTATLRYEDVDFRSEDALLSPGSARKWSDSVLVPGAGALYKINDALSLRASVNRGVTVAGLDLAGVEKREESVNYEAGVKYFSSEEERSADFTAFVNDYANITGTCTASAGCNSSQLDVQFNGGKARVAGLEARFAQGFSVGRLWLPVQFNVTWLKASFENEFLSQSDEWGRGIIRKGMPLPYVPELQYTLSLGAHYRRFRQELSILYQGKMYDQSYDVGREEIEAYGILDWNAGYELEKGFELFAKVDNLLAKDYVVSFRPAGFRPGKPRAFMLGVNYRL